MNSFIAQNNINHANNAQGKKDKFLIALNHESPYLPMCLED